MTSSVRFYGNCVANTAISILVTIIYINLFCFNILLDLILKRIAMCNVLSLQL